MSSAKKTQLKVAVPQVEPEWLNLEAGIKKSVELIEEAKANGADLIAFSECWIPGYPTFLWGNAYIETLPFVKRYYENSIERDSEHIKTIRRAAKDNKIFVVFGYVEKYKGSLFMAQTFIDENGDVLMHRHKLKPTHVERTLFGDSTGDSVMNVVDTNYGRVGALQCWEHLQPLLKYHTFFQNEQIHIASWPTTNKWQGKELYSVSNEASKVASRMYAIEGQCFVLAASHLVGEKAAKVFSDGFSKSHMDSRGGGHSAVYGPDGSLLTDEVPDTWEGILYAEIDLNDIHLAKNAADAVGHYSRPDIFQLLVDNEPKSQCIYKGSSVPISCDVKTFSPLEEVSEELATLKVSTEAEE